MSSKSQYSSPSIKKKRPRRAKYVRKEPVLPSPCVQPKKLKSPSRYEPKVTNRVKQLTRQDLINMNVPPNLHYLISTPGSPFFLKTLKNESDLRSSNGVILIPPVFSLCDNAEETFYTLKKVIYAFFIDIPQHIVFDYANCTRIDIEAQALMDVILMEYKTFLNKCSSLTTQRAIYELPVSFGGRNMNDERLKKMMFSIGSPANLGIKKKDFPDIIKYPMCSHRALTENDRKELKARKELDTSLAIDYVIECLRKMGKKLTPKKRSDLCTVIGEILINAEEHSTLHHRFSMGYFHEVNENGKHTGLFHLVILNFGASIYEKFSNNAECPEETVNKMRALSEKYTSRSLFRSGEFEEETLWTLYALQQGVTSVPDMQRGSGTIQFIRSFFNIKGSQDVDNISRMMLLSGKTEILFDGTYGVQEKIDGNNKFNVMTFNESGNIEDRPDQRFVKTTDTYFPGTIIAAKILLNEDDVKEIN